VSDWLGMVLEEYKSLRTEAMAARDAQLAVLRFGVAIVGVLVALGIALRDEEGALAGAFLCLIVPSVIFFVLELWVGEIERAIRAGSFVAAIEERLALHFQDQAESAPMGWEIWLRQSVEGKRSEHTAASVGRTLVIFALFVVFMGGSAAAGAFALNDHGMDTLFWLFLMGAVEILIVMAVRARFVYRRLRKLDAPPSLDNVWGFQKVLD